MSSASPTNYQRSLAGANTTGYVLTLGQESVNFVRLTKLEISVNGTTGDYWVLPGLLEDGAAAPAIPTDPRPAAGVDTGWLQVKSGETITLGERTSKGYDKQTFNLRCYTHLLVLCQAAGTVSATQLRIIGS